MNQKLNQAQFWILKHDRKIHLTKSTYKHLKPLNKLLNFMLKQKYQYKTTFKTKSLPLNWPTKIVQSFHSQQRNDALTDSTVCLANL